MLSLIFVFLLGLILGSFLGMLTYRLPLGLSILGRSFCDNCGKKVSWTNNIPVLSYLLLNGKSICCDKKISIRYPIIEILTGIIFVFTFFLFRSISSGDFGLPFLWWVTAFGDFSFWIFLLVVFSFIGLIVIDVEHQILPDILLKFLSIPILLFLLLSPAPVLFEGLLWGFISFIFFLLIYLITRERGMGYGDVKMAFLLGALLGFPGTLTWLLLAFLGGSVVGCVLLLFRRARIGKPIPFGPFLLVSAYISFFWGSELFIWYTLKLVEGF